MAERIAISTASRSSRPVFPETRNDTEQPAYFAFDFLPSRFDRFFL
jgi:hypothetical protein